MERGKDFFVRRAFNETGKGLQRVKLCRHPHGRTNVKTNIRQTNWLKQSQSPPPGTSHSHQNRKAYETPKRSKLRCNDRSSGDSPDTVQDIIWEPASPPSSWNAKGSKKSGAAEISDIVNRIAPKEEEHKGQQSPVLEWIGEGAIRCTPDVPVPRPRRISARQNSVEDLKKLAREFDLRINKDQQEADRDGHPASSDKPEGGRAVLDAELNALFDGPTQYLSRELSQASSTSSQEAKASLASAVVDKGNSGPKKGSGAPSTAASNAAEPSKSASEKGDFDQDWEDDDLFNDSFVLEMTQNPAALDGAPVRTSAPAPPPPHLLGSKAGAPVIKANPSVSARMSASGQAVPSSSRGGGIAGSVTGVPLGLRLAKPETSAKPSTFMQEPSGRSLGENATSGAPWKPCLSATDAGRHERDRIYPSTGEHQTTAPANASKGTNTGSSGTDTGSSDISSGAHNISTGVLQSQTLSEDVWAAEGDEDDDLLYQVCDLVERLSSSQEAARASGRASEPADIKPAPSYTRQLSLPPTNDLSTQAHGVVTGSWPPALTSSTKKSHPQYGFTRSLSVPNNSAASTATVSANRIQSSGFSAGRGAHNHPTAAAASVSHGPNQYRFTKLKSPPTRAQCQPGSTHPQGPRGPVPTSSHQPSSVSKRHLQEPRPLANKVFVPNQRPVKCSAAEIERKKQEAIARRKLRIVASHKPTMPSKCPLPL